jgi:hypothetical protein
MQRGELCIVTAQNRLSSVNRILTALRDDQDVRIHSPSQALGMLRSTVCMRAPDGKDIQQVLRVVIAICEQQHERVASVVMLAQVIGMRLREAILADLPRLHREAELLSRFNIQDGCEVGRSEFSAPRWILIRWLLTRHRKEIATYCPKTKSMFISCNKMLILSA